MDKNGLHKCQSDAPKKERAKRRSRVPSILNKESSGKACKMTLNEAWVQSLNPPRSNSRSSFNGSNSFTDASENR